MEELLRRGGVVRGGGLRNLPPIWRQVVCTRSVLEGGEPPHALRQRGRGALGPVQRTMSRPCRDGGSQYCIIHLWDRWVYVQAHLLTSPCRTWKPSFWGSAAGRSQRRWRSRSWGMSPQHPACATWSMTRRQGPTTLCMGGGHHRHGSFTIAASASIPWVQSAGRSASLNCVAIIFLRG